MDELQPTVIGALKSKMRALTRYSKSDLIQLALDIISGKSSSSNKQAPSKQQTEFDRFYIILQDSQAKPIELSLDFLKVITNDFSEEKILGHGGFGVVYKGGLENGKAIAVKKLNNCTENLDDAQYKKELETLFGLQHKNIVQFKGYCADSSQVLVPEPESLGTGKIVLAEIRERVLCFEYVSEKSLRDHISDESRGLNWQERFEIIKGICSGLHYLHTEHDIAHMDLKPENILLDNNMVPKIADFGTSRLFPENVSQIITKTCVGSLGYMAPEYINEGLVSKKADIFSFGVIIQELLTGSRSNDIQEKRKLRKYVVGKWRNKPDADSRQVRTCIEIASECVDTNQEKRPTADYIIQKLNDVKDPSSSWSWEQRTPKVAIGLGSVLLILLMMNASSSWSWVITTLNVVTAVVIVFAIGAAVLVLNMKDHYSSRPRMMLFTIGAALPALFVLLSTNSLWSLAVLTMKVVTLFAVMGVLIVVVIFYPLAKLHVLNLVHRHHGRVKFQW